MLPVLRSTGFKLWCGIGLISTASLVCAEAVTKAPQVSSKETTLNADKKWATDDAVRQGMERIRQVMTASQPGIAQERLSAQDYQRLAETIDQNMALIVKTRTVSKEAEKAFHLIVMMDFKQSSELMRLGATVQLQRTGALGVLQALRNYGQYFEHSGWISPS